jgi:hypothetical protein
MYPQSCRFFAASHDCLLCRVLPVSARSGTLVCHNSLNIIKQLILTSPNPSTSQIYPEIGFLSAWRGRQVEVFGKFSR